MFLDYADEPIQIIKGNEAVLVLVYVAEQEQVVLEQFLVVDDV